MSNLALDCAFSFLSPEAQGNTWLKNTHYFPQTATGLEMDWNEYESRI